MKALLVYATKHGSVATVAEKLQRHIADMVIVNCKDNRSITLDGFDTIILGASLYAGNIQSEMKKFIASHEAALRTTRIAVFLCAGEYNYKTFTANFPAWVMEKAVVHDTLGHAFYFEKMNFLERTIVKAISGKKESEEHFDEEKIAAFATKVKE